MAYQPLYGTISDNQGYRRSTSSQRGRVNQVSAWINSFYGTVFTASARYIECPMPVIYRTGLTPKQYSQKIKEARGDVESRHRVAIEVELQANPRFEYIINGLPIPQKKIEHLNKLGMERFELQLSCLRHLRDTNRQVQAMKLATAIMTGKR